MAGDAPPLPFRGVPIIICPVSGLPVHLDEAVWCNGSWVHPWAYDDYSLVDDFDPTTPHEHPLWNKQRRRANRPYPRRRRF